MSEQSSFLSGRGLREFGVHPRLVEKLIKFVCVYTPDDLLDLTPDDVAGMKLSDDERHSLELHIWEAASRQ